MAVLRERENPLGEALKVKEEIREGEEKLRVKRKRKALEERIARHNALIQTQPFPEGSHQGINSKIAHLASLSPEGLVGEMLTAFFFATVTFLLNLHHVEQCKRYKVARLNEENQEKPGSAYQNAIEKDKQSSLAFYYFQCLIEKDPEFARYASYSPERFLEKLQNNGEFKKRFLEAVYGVDNITSSAFRKFDFLTRKVPEFSKYAGLSYEEFVKNIKDSEFKNNFEKTWDTVMDENSFGPEVVIYPARAITEEDYKTVFEKKLEKQLEYDCNKTLYSRKIEQIQRARPNLQGIKQAERLAYNYYHTYDQKALFKGYHDQLPPLYPFKPGGMEVDLDAPSLTPEQLMQMDTTQRRALIAENGYESDPSFLEGWYACADGLAVDFMGSSVLDPLRQHRLYGRAAPRPEKGGKKEKPDLFSDRAAQRLASPASHT